MVTITMERVFRISSVLLGLVTMKLIRSRYGRVLILKKCPFVGIGILMHKDLLFKMIATMIKILVHPLETWVTKAVF